MYVINEIINDDVLYIAICDVCGLPFKEEDVTHAYHIHHKCYWGLDMHSPDSKDTLESLGFKEYNDTKTI